MKLQIVSDLHMEYVPWHFPETDADVLLVAGDLFDDGESSARWAANEAQRTGKRLLWVPGNHEFMNSVLPQQLARMRSICRGSGAELLFNQCVTIGGVRFAGTTLWTDFCLGGAAFQSMAMHAVGDLFEEFKNTCYRQGERLTPDDQLRLHGRARRFLERVLEDSFQVPTVVITHHAPSFRSIAQGYEKALTSAAFASQMDSFIAYANALLWVHGHVHTPHDYLIASTRVICNPRGLTRGAEPAHFDSSLVVTVPESV